MKKLVNDLKKKRNRKTKELPKYYNKWIKANIIDNINLSRRGEIKVTALTTYLLFDSHYKPVLKEIAELNINKPNYSRMQAIIAKFEYDSTYTFYIKISLGE